MTHIESYIEKKRALLRKRWAEKNRPRLDPTCGFINTVCPASLTSWNEKESRAAEQARQDRALVRDASVLYQSEAETAAMGPRCRVACQTSVTWCGKHLGHRGQHRYSIRPRAEEVARLKMDYLDRWGRWLTADLSNMPGLR